MGLNTTPRTWVTDEVVTATQLNAEIRDAIAGLQAAWTSYTPVWTPTGTAVGNGTLLGRYRQVGKTVDFEVSLVAGSTTTGGSGQWGFSLPVPYASRYSLRSVFGRGLVYDISPGAYYPAILYLSGLQAVSLLTTDTRAVASAGTPITLAAGDILTLSGRYEAA